ncbi:MAG: hypothetical protein Q8O42_20245 [Acidobacteriota bacterium]|nr:hypothetical protein [Acidobacteriota bacterium]
MTAPPSSLWLGGAVIVGAVIAATLTVAGPAPPVPATAEIRELWQDPGDVAARDLRWGRGGQALRPSPDVDYQFETIDALGYSAGYDVVDPDGRRWDVKTGEEAQPELIASRVLWAIGFQQPVVYFVAEWRLANGPVATPLPGRFRLDSDHATVGDWSWTDNPFKGTRELKGLLLANLLINNWDLKTSNNKIYTLTSATGSERWFVVQDLGASLGKTAWPLGNRNQVDDYESQDFIVGVQDGRVQVDYHARRRHLLEDLTPGDVVWITQLLSRITDRQWADVFAAAAMPDDVSARYIRKIKSKIQEGLALQAHTVNQS